MNTTIHHKRLSPFSLVKYSIVFFGANFVLVFGLGLIAAIGRAIQLGAIDGISGGINSVLEIITETARVVTFLLVIGEGIIRKGVQRIKSISF